MHDDDDAICGTSRNWDSALSLSSGQDEVVLPAGVYDVNGQQLDTRRENSWLLKLGDVATVEAAEVLAVNALAPFTLNSRLKQGLLKAVELTTHRTGQAGAAFIINVSAMEVLCTYPDHGAVFLTGVRFVRVSSIASKRRITRTQTWLRRR